MQGNLFQRGQSLIGIIVVLVAVGLITGGLYFYLSRQIPKEPEITRKQAAEEVAIPLDWKTFTHDTYGFSISAPSDYSLNYKKESVLGLKNIQGEKIIFFFKSGFSEDIKKKYIELTEKSDRLKGEKIENTNKAFTVEIPGIDVPQLIPLTGNIFLSAELIQRAHCLIISITMDTGKDVNIFPDYNPEQSKAFDGHLSYLKENEEIASKIVKTMKCEQ